LLKLSIHLPSENNLTVLDDNISKSKVFALKEDPINTAPLDDLDLTHLLQNLVDLKEENMDKIRRARKYLDQVHQDRLFNEGRFRLVKLKLKRQRNG